MAETATSTTEVHDISDSDLNTLAGTLEKRYGLDLLSYKPRLLKRRIMVRLRSRRCSDLAEYARILEADNTEWDALLKALNINVSGFFRNSETFWLLRDKVLPGLLKDARRRDQGLSMASIGCAQGEEPYSLAMLLDFSFKKELKGLRIQIVGVDVEKTVIEVARKAVYGRDRVKEVPEEYLSRYFEGCGKEYRLDKEIREAVKFKVRDIRKGPGIAKLDLVMCRNLLIYFTREQQKQILNSIGKCLLPGGYLVLGKTESMLGELRSGYKVVDLSEHIYQKAGE